MVAISHETTRRARKRLRRAEHIVELSTDTTRLARVLFVADLDLGAEFSGFVHEEVPELVVRKTHRASRRLSSYLSRPFSGGCRTLSDDGARVEFRKKNHVVVCTEPSGKLSMQLGDEVGRSLSDSRRCSCESAFPSPSGARCPRF